MDIIPANIKLPDGSDYEVLAVITGPDGRKSDKDLRCDIVSNDLSNRLNDVNLKKFIANTNAQLAIMSVRLTDIDCALSIDELERKCPAVVCKLITGSESVRDQYASLQRGLSPVIGMYAFSRKSPQVLSFICTGERVRGMNLGSVLHAHYENYAKKRYAPKDLFLVATPESVPFHVLNGYTVTEIPNMNEKFEVQVADGVFVKVHSEVLMRKQLKC